MSEMREVKVRMTDEQHKTLKRVTELLDARTPEDFKVSQSKAVLIALKRMAESLGLSWPENDEKWGGLRE